MLICCRACFRISGDLSWTASRISLSTLDLMSSRERLEKAMITGSSPPRVVRILSFRLSGLGGAGVEVDGREVEGREVEGRGVEG